MPAMTTRLTGSVTVLELEELLELDDSSPRDELLLNNGPLELLTLLDDGALLLD